MASGPASQSGDDSCHLRTTRYDRVSSLLLSLLMLLGLTVSIMLIGWLTGKIFVSQTAVPVEMADFPGDEGPVGGGQNPEPPNPEEIRELELEQPVLKETVSALAAVVKTKAPELDDPLIARKETSDSGFGDGRGSGRGSGVGPGKGGKQRRWEVYFIKGSSLDVYARQLDFFGIELAVPMPNGQVTYVSNLAKAKPDTRVGVAGQEQRYYLLWRSGDLQQADRELLARAGVKADDRIILKFLPPALEAQLVALERSYRGADPKTIRKTRFGVQPAGDGYSFYVIEQSINP